MKVAAAICPLCGDTGWKTVMAGPEKRVTRCDCQLRSRSQSLLVAAGIPKRYEHCELAEFDTRFEGAQPSLERALLAAKSFGWLFAVILVMNIFWCAALPLVEATTMGHLKGRLGDYGRIRVWGSVSFVISVVLLGQILDRTGIAWLPVMLVVLFTLMMTDWVTRKLNGLP